MAAGNKRTPTAAAHPPPTPDVANTSRQTTTPTPDPGPQADFVGIAQAFGDVKDRWGLSDVKLQFSPRLFYSVAKTPDNPAGQGEAAAWYDLPSKTVLINVPALQDVARQMGPSPQYRNGLHDAIMVYLQGVIDHELSHGFRAQEMRAQHGYDWPIPGQEPLGYPHDERMSRRTLVMNRQELPPLIDRLSRQQFQEDDPAFQAAPELFPSFFGNSPWPFGSPPQPGQGLTSIGGRGAS